MTVQEIRNLKWVRLEETEEYKDWNLLPKRTWGTDVYIRNDLVELYLDDVYKQISRKLDISFDELSKLIKEENATFYTLKKEIFTRSNVKDSDKSWKAIKSFLMIPDITSVPMVPIVPKDKLESRKINESESHLSYGEVKQTKESLKEFEDNKKKSSAEKLLEDFKKLSDLEKFQVLNTLKLLQVKFEFPTN